MLLFEGVAKAYKTLWRKTSAVSDFELHLRAGEIVGLVGANGAGKTTLIQLALGYLNPTAGAIHMLGAPAGDVSTRSRVGWVPDEPIFPRSATARRLLRDWLTGHGLPTSRRRERTDQLLATFDLEHAADRRINTYSLGMQQKTSLMLAVSHEPELLILDEPFSALDHRAMLRVRGFLSEFRDAGGSVLVSSHHLSELEFVCDRAVFLSQGRVQREERLGAEGGAAFVQITMRNGDGVRAALDRACPEYLRDWAVEDDSLTGKLTERDRVPDLVALLVAQGARIRSVAERGARLEPVFLELEGGG